MKKLLFYHRYMIAGGEARALMDIVSALDKSKYDVSVMLEREAGDMYKDAVGLLKFKRPFESFVVPKYRIFRKLRSMLINYSEKNRKKYPKLYHRLAIGTDYDIEVSFSFAGAEYMIANSSNKKSKKIVWVHCDFLKDEGLIKYHSKYNKDPGYYSKFDKYVCVSKTAKESFDKVFDQKYDSVIKYNPVNNERINYLAKAPIDAPESFNGKKIICSVGRFGPEKGYERLVRIHKRLLQKGVDHVLILVGDGELRDKIQAAITEEDVGNTVLLTGYDNNPYKYMAKSDFFVCSSFTEGLPIVCQEALALGIPIVSSFPSVGELFGDETCGILSDVDDDSLMAAIEKMLTDEEFYKKCKAGAEKRAEYFDSKNSIKEIEKMFDELLENS